MTVPEQQQWQQSQEMMRRFAVPQQPALLPPPPRKRTWASATACAHVPASSCASGSARRRARSSAPHNRRTRAHRRGSHPRRKGKIRRQPWLHLHRCSRCFSDSPARERVLDRPWLRCYCASPATASWPELFLAAAPRFECARQLAWVSAAGALAAAQIVAAAACGFRIRVAWAPQPPLVPSPPHRLMRHIPSRFSLFSALRDGSLALCRCLVLSGARRADSEGRG